MASAARKDEVMLVIDSAYRSVAYQKVIYKRLMAQGKTFAEIALSVAPPGYSEHVLGLAVDFYPSDWRFAKERERNKLNILHRNFFVSCA